MPRVFQIKSPVFRGSVVVVGIAAKDFCYLSWRTGRTA